MIRWPRGAHGKTSHIPLVALALAPALSTDAVRVVRLAGTEEAGQLDRRIRRDLGRDLAALGALEPARVAVVPAAVQAELLPELQPLPAPAATRTPAPEHPGHQAPCGGY